MNKLITTIKSIFPQQELAAVRECICEWNTMKKPSQIGSIKQMFTFDIPCANPRSEKIQPRECPSDNDLKKQGLTKEQWHKKVSDENFTKQSSFINDLIKAGVLVYTDNSEEEEDLRQVKHVNLSQKQLDIVKDTLPRLNEKTPSFREQSLTDYNAQQKAYGYSGAVA